MNTRMSRRPGTAYGEIIRDPKPYDESLLPTIDGVTIWELMPPMLTKIDLQFDSYFTTDVDFLLKALGLPPLPLGYRPLDVRQVDTDPAVKAYISVAPNLRNGELVDFVRKLEMGRAGSDGLRLDENKDPEDQSVRIASWYLGVVALKKGYYLHNRCSVSLYQKRELREAKAARAATIQPMLQMEV